MIEPKALLDFTRTYLTTHPEELPRLAKNVRLLRFGLPLEALRFLVGRIKGRKAPKDVVIEAVPPGIRIAATLNLMKTPVRLGATLIVEHVRLSPDEMRFELRLRNVALAVAGDADTPVAALIKSGSLDLSKPGNLVAFMPKRPPLLVEAVDDRIVIDLMREPKIADKASRFISVITPLVSVRSIETETDHLDVYLSYLPDGLTGLSTALAAVRASL